MTLYKYLTVEKADEWLIRENSILLTPPMYLNDLLEFRVRREPADPEERRALFEEFQRESPRNLTFEEFDPSITSREHMDNEPVEMRRMLSEKLGVVSLSSDPTNELMWAHYGLNSGVAVGYQSEDVAEKSGMRFSFLPIGIAMEVKYSNDVVPMKKDFSDAPHHLTTKRLCWSYEKEWRIVTNLQDAELMERDDKKFYALPACSEQIAEVVFGANAERDFIGRVTDWLRGSTAIRQRVGVDPTTHDLVLSEMAKSF